MLRVTDRYELTGIGNSPSSLASEILYFNNIRNFLIEKNIKILRYEDENKIILQLKSWMMEKGYALTSKKYRSVYEIVATETPGIIKHMKKILRYSQKDGGVLRTGERCVGIGQV